MAAEPLQIEASVLGADPALPEEVSTVRGQVQVASTPGRVLGVRLHPEDPKACGETIRAIHEADWIILGPGSWFTSVMPHLLVPSVREALVASPARKVLTLNLVMHTGETEGFSAENHLEVLAAHAPELTLDVVLADPSVVEDAAVLRSVAAGLGAQLVVAPVAEHGAPGHHDSLRLAAAYRDILG
jgi:uncharacterized cofD-like protein